MTPVAESTLPIVLVVDDICGRTVTTGNEERAALCARLGLEDVTSDSDPTTQGQSIKSPIARAVFARGQTPAAAGRNDTVKNDLDGVLRLVEAGPEGDGALPWALILLDLSF